MSDDKPNHGYTNVAILFSLSLFDGRSGLILNDDSDIKKRLSVGQFQYLCFWLHH